jgi:hypothetical protein
LPGFHLVSGDFSIPVRIGTTHSAVNEPPFSAKLVKGNDAILVRIYLLESLSAWFAEGDGCG